MTLSIDQVDSRHNHDFRRLLDDYTLVVNRRTPGALPATALRTASLSARSLLAHLATNGSASLDDLTAAARAGDAARLLTFNVHPGALADLARVFALQNLLPDDSSVALALYDLGLEQFGPDVRHEHQGLHAQLALQLRRPDRAAWLCKTYDRMSADIRARLRLDLINPFTTNSGSTADWLRAFQDILPIVLTDDTNLAPFDRVSAVPARAVERDARVAVVVTSYRPGVGLLTAVQSIASQSWTNLEIIVVDDASPPEYSEVLSTCAGLDPRVKVIVLPRNNGTYVARNVGLDAATGDFVTFQDADDWSHPTRVEAQVAPLISDHSIAATTTDGLRADENLVVSRPGRAAIGLNTSSILLRKGAVIDRVGYFDEVRKSADTEYMLRIGAAFGPRAVVHVGGKPYALIRHSATSLSTGDFRGGWVHPARLAYRSGYALWHDKIRSGASDGYMPREPATRPFAAPAQFLTHQESASAQAYDVIFASDWRPYGGPQKSMIEEIGSLCRRGFRVAVMQMEAYRFMTKERRHLCEPVQELINSGAIDHVLSTDNVDVSLLVIRYPPVLQFAARVRSDVRAKRVIILANQAPSEADGSDLRYLTAQCTEAVKDIFDVDPQWCPQGPAVRAELASTLKPEQLTAFDMPGIIDEDVWLLERTGFRSDIPILGRHSRDNWTKWPKDRRTLLQAYPAASDIDVRIMGGGKAARSILGVDHLPANWLVYDYDEVSVRSFLFQLDFWVYYPHPIMIEAFGRAILEAMASGCVVILPHHFRSTFGDGAVYASSEHVMDTVRLHYSDKAMFLRQSRRGQERVREMYSHQSYAQLVSTMMSAAGSDETGQTSAKDGYYSQVGIVT